MVINIHNSGKELELPVGIYSVKVLGGWGVEVGSFTFELKNKSNGKIIKPIPTMMRVQSYESGQRAKK